MRALAALTAAAALAAGCGGGGGGAVDCEVDPQDRARPFEPLERDRTYRIEFETTHGSFSVELDGAKAPCNGGSLFQLARSGFFDGTRFHRIVPGFVVQGGDPTGMGTGGPGYTTVDEPVPQWKYTKGTVAMAKAQSEPAGAGGSQFFIVTADDAELPAEYAVVGRVADGLQVVERIGRLGDPATERPTQRVAIVRAAVAAD